MYGTRVFRNSIFKTALMVLATLMWAPVSQASPVKESSHNQVGKSDLNGDQVVDAADLAIFSDRFLRSDWTSADWCTFYDATLAGINFVGPQKTGATIKDKPAAYYNKHYGQLLDFIYEYQACGVVPLPAALELEHYPQLLLRMTMSKDGSGDIYIADPRIGSVYFYDEGYLPRAELKGLSRPLGLAVDSNGYLLVGNDGRDNVEVYDLTSGEMVTSFGSGLLIMPNSITVDRDGDIYVTDSRHHRVFIYDATYQYVGHIGSPGWADDELMFPVDTQVIERMVDGVLVKEVFVADQINERIQIFSTDGRILRHIYPGDCRMGMCEPPRLANLQALDIDALGRLHALDNFEAVVSILDPASGDYLGEYGEYGEGPGYLWMPLGLVISDTGVAVVSSGVNDRLEVYLLQ